jgi:hypothetical protein
MELLEQPELVAELERQILQCWRELYDIFYDLTQPYIPGSCTQWLPVYHKGRCALIEADLISMISPECFENIYLPVIKERADYVERSLFHLDGPEAARHVEALLEIPRLDGIQWEPGARYKNAPEWIKLLQKIQRRKKCLWVTCGVKEIEELLGSLSPYGLILNIRDCDSIETARLIEKTAERCAAKNSKKGG